jgi:hypothetical protein
VVLIEFIAQVLCGIESPGRIDESGWYNLHPLLVTALEPLMYPFA